MARIVILGATGSLGRQVLRQALAAGHDVTAFVRTPSRLPREEQQRVLVHTGDLTAGLPVDVLRGHDALVNCAGHVTDGETFVALVDTIATSVDKLRVAEQPVCGFSPVQRSSTLIRRAAGSWICHWSSRRIGRTR
jgi:uncharacterized protein YbjT (DUF2867 family)